MSQSQGQTTEQLHKALLKLAAQLDVKVTLTAAGDGWWERVVRWRRSSRPNELGSYQLLPSLSGWKVRIQVRDSLSADERCRILVHELAHALLHGNPIAGCNSIRTRELEAGLCELITLAEVGVCSTETVAYLHHWSKSGCYQLSDERTAYVQQVARRLSEGVNNCWHPASRHLSSD
jgi:hypothetical protein